MSLLISVTSCSSPEKLSLLMVLGIVAGSRLCYLAQDLQVSTCTTYDYREIHCEIDGLIGK